MKRIFKIQIFIFICDVCSLHFGILSRIYHNSIILTLDNLYFSSMQLLYKLFQFLGLNFYGLNSK